MATSPSSPGGGAARRLLDTADVGRRASGRQWRPRLLRAFLRRVARREKALLRCCAWCDRVEVDGEFVAPEDLLPGGLSPAARAAATHTICPSCIERETAARPAGSGP